MLLLVACFGTCAPGPAAVDLATPSPAPDFGSSDGSAADGPLDLGGAPLRVLSLNLHCLKLDGTSYPDNGQRLDAVARAAAAHGIDVLLAQEVCERPGESARALLLSALERRTGVAWSVESVLAHRAWGGTPDEAEEHVAIFARGAGALNHLTRHVLRTQAGLQRVVMGATFQGLRVYSVHLDHLDAAARAAQAREVAALAAFEADPSLAIVVGGDFNAQPGAAAPQALLDMGFADAAAALAQDRIDHAFVHRGAPLEPAAAELLFTGAEAVSDHPGVFVTLRRRPAPLPHLTRIRVTAPSGLSLWVRGGTRPLSWTGGWPTFLGEDGRYRFVTSELPPGPFEYKLLRDDQSWQLGANAQGQGHSDNQTSPLFP